MFCLAEGRRRRREPFLCAGRRRGAPRPSSRLSPPKEAAFLSPADSRHRGFKNNRHGGGNAAMTGICSAPGLQPHGLLAAPFGAAARTGPGPGPGRAAPPSPLPAARPRSPRAALQQGPGRETPCAGAGGRGGDRARGRSGAPSRRQWCNILPPSEGKK